MKPYFSMPVMGEFHSYSVLMIVSFFICFGLAFYYLKPYLNGRRIATLFFTTSWLSFIGARLFHVLFENHEYYLNNPSLIFARFDGMSFYGSFFTGAIVIWMFTRIWQLDSQSKKHLWDFSVLSLVISYTLMRLGCFANGCCWGKSTSYFLALEYLDPRTMMPTLGIPVHPVQLYDAAHGLFMILMMVLLRRENFLQGKHLLVFCIIYPIGRFWTEFYRAHDLGFEDVLLGLSIHQLISIGVLGVGLFGLGKSTLRIDSN